jgi:hypothetical protein
MQNICKCIVVAIVVTVNSIANSNKSSGTNNES